MPIFTAPWRKLSLFLVLLVATPTSWAVNDLDLWLPSSMRDLMPQLRKAALAVEATEECSKLMQAGLYEPSRKAEVPKFRMLCRDANRRSYAVLVNSQSLEITYPGRKPEVTTFNKKMVASIWRNCQQQLQQKTKFMNDMVLLTKGMPKPDTSEPGALTMLVDFDAKTMQGKPLRYRATCFATLDKPARLTIKGRP
ncbi:MAG: hypothetical protein AseanaTS_14900 [Candidatus Pelagadaptatus aseana]|uniref:hypothetical protein n=1 Tax=Candidatus Pelagadaptatus aseana TaxID=3120508 RepID=UPI0039B180FE